MSSNFACAVIQVAPARLPMWLVSHFACYPPPTHTSNGPPLTSTHLNYVTNSYLSISISLSLVNKHSLQGLSNWFLRGLTACSCRIRPCQPLVTCHHDTPTERQNSECRKIERRVTQGLALPPAPTFYFQLWTNVVLCTQWMARYTTKPLVNFIQSFVQKIFQ